MNRLTKITITSIFLVFSMSLFVGAQSVKFESSLDRSEMGFDELLTLTMRLKYDPLQVEPSSSKAPRPILKRLEYNSFSSKSSSVRESGVSLTELVFEYKLKPIASGTGRVGAVTVEFKALEGASAQQVSSEEQVVQIAIPRVEEETAGWLGLPIWFWVLLGFSVVCGVLAFWILGRRGDDVEDPSTIAVHTRLVLLKSLTSKRRSQFYQMMYDAFYDLSTDAGLSSAKRGDSEQLVADIQAASLPGEIREPLVRWLSESAKEKFAPDSGQPGETVREYHEVENFLRDKWLPFRRKLDEERRVAATKSRV